MAIEVLVRQQYGWTIYFGRRMQWHSREATTPMWPRVLRGGDEDCNESLCFVMWPLGRLVVFWRRHLRVNTGICNKCRDMMTAYLPSGTRFCRRCCTSGQAMFDDDGDLCFICVKKEEVDGERHRPQE